MTNQLRVGQTVRNFGILAKVTGFHAITGDPILRPLWNDGTSWVAKAGLCEPVEEHPTGLIHREGLVCFD